MHFFSKAECFHPDEECRRKIRAGIHREDGPQGRHVAEGSAGVPGTRKDAGEADRRLARGRGEETKGLCFF